MGNHVLPLRAWALSFVTVFCWTCWTHPSVLAQEPVDVDGGPPSIRVGDWLRINPRMKLQLDLNSFRPEFSAQAKTIQAKRVRFGVDGTLFRDFAYSARVETRTGDPEFRDVFLRYQRFNSFQLQAGRFKIPFGLDQLTDSGELDFVQRSRIGSIVAPGRDTGAMVLGETSESKIRYAAGVFRHDGRNSEIEDFAAVNETLPGGNRTLAARVVIQPTELLSISTPPVRHLSVGAAFTHSDLATGLSSLPGVTASNQVFFPRMYAKGTRVRRGAELKMVAGSTSLQGEFMDAREDRIDQGLRGEDLPALKTRGWYVSAVQPVIGRLDNASRPGFLKSLIPGRQLGLIEVAARYEAIHFGSVSSDGAAPSRSSRAANVIGNEDRAWTLGINWHANRYVKVQFNGIRETLSDAARTPIDGESHYWKLVTRLQIYF